MDNLSKFHVVFSSSTVVRLNKDAFEGHLCQTVNNFVKQNKSSLLSPLRKGVHPNTSSISETLEYLEYPVSTFDERCSSTLHPPNVITVVFLVWVPNRGAILHKRANQRKVSSLLTLLCAAFRPATQKLVCHGSKCKIDISPLYTILIISIILIIICHYKNCFVLVFD